jgi:hypothetical protein
MMLYRFYRENLVCMFVIMHSSQCKVRPLTFSLFPSLNVKYTPPYRYNRLFLLSICSCPLLLSLRCTEGILGTGGGGVPSNTDMETGRLGVRG